MTFKCSKCHKDVDTLFHSNVWGDICIDCFFIYSQLVDIHRGVKE